MEEHLILFWRLHIDEVPATMPKINDDEVSNPFASCENDSEPTVRGTLLVRLLTPPLECFFALLIFYSVIFDLVKELLSGNLLQASGAYRSRAKQLWEGRFHWMERISKWMRYLESVTKTALWIIMWQIVALIYNFVQISSVKYGVHGRYLRIMQAVYSP